MAEKEPKDASAGIAEKMGLNYDVEMDRLASKSLILELICPFSNIKISVILWVSNIFLRRRL